MAGFQYNKACHVHLGHWVVEKYWGSVELNHPGRLDSVTL